MNTKKEKGYLLYTNNGFFNIDEKTGEPELNLTKAKMFKDKNEILKEQKKILMNGKKLYIRTLTIKVY